MVFEACYNMTLLPMSLGRGMGLSVPFDGFEPFAELFGTPVSALQCSASFNLVAFDESISSSQMMGLFPEA